MWSKFLIAISIRFGLMALGHAAGAQSLAPTLASSVNLGLTPDDAPGQPAATESTTDLAKKLQTRLAELSLLGE